MSVRRLNRIILGAPTLLKSVTSIEIATSANCETANAFAEYFLPKLRYNNPSLTYAVTRLADQEANSSHMKIKFREEGSFTSLYFNDFATPHQMMVKLMELDQSES